MIANLALFPLEKAINAYLQLDPNTRTTLKEMSGKTVKVDISDWGLFFYLNMKNNSIQLSVDQCTNPDATLSGTLFGLFRTGLAKGDTSAAFSNKIETSGDVQLATQLQSLLKDIDIDWEEQLSKCTGDAIAFTIGKTLRNTHTIIQKSLNSIKASTCEYIHEEAKLAPTKQELEGFYQQVRDTRDALDRLDARIHFLEEKQNS